MATHAARNMKFEKQPKRVIYLTDQDIYRVTFDSVHKPIRLPKDARRHLVGIAAAVSYWDNVDRRDHCLGCARTIQESWNAGDRYLLDTDEARRAAELVADLANTKPDAIDICSALSDLQNAIAQVRLSNLTMDDFEVMPACQATLEKCFSLPEFVGWNAQARRRRFLYELERKDRTPLVYTIMGLYFNYGATPVLTNKQRQELLRLDRGTDVKGAILFFDNCLRQISAYRFA